MKFASLGSGSQGNATVVVSGAQALLIDCGFSVKATTLRLNRLGVSPTELTGVLVTHEHGDHFKGVMPLARRFDLPVYMTAGTAAATGTALSDVQLVKDDLSFVLGDITVMPVAVPHDAREPVQYVFSTQGKKLGILTDLGRITPHVIEHYRDCDGLVLEANHDLEMLRNGSYPPRLKQRVSGDWGHLNNLQSRELLDNVELARIQQLVLGHISQQNNSIEKVKRAITPLADKLNEIQYACQEQGFDWLQLH